MSEQRLAGKVILVTASTRGIGLAIVRRCAAEGATVYMAARNMESAAARAAEINAQGGCVKEASQRTNRRGKRGFRGNVPGNPEPPPIARRFDGIAG